ncbi:MAG: helix-turn-helix transcriptional regulator [Burkholderiales bacterium]|nr:helix-turn-helix transcriptional regulator [Burkholderiales bacterium]
MARALAMIEDARKSPRRRPALQNDRTLQTLVPDLVAARTAAGMTQEQVALRMWTRRTAESRLDSGRYARPTLDIIQKYAKRCVQTPKDTQVGLNNTFRNPGALA